MLRKTYSGQLNGSLVVAQTYTPGCYNIVAKDNKGDTVIVSLEAEQVMALRDDLASIHFPPKHRGRFLDSSIDFLDAWMESESGAEDQVILEYFAEYRRNKRNKHGQETET